jgi:protein-S-isoprenylcysteine O-methyltransferase Ste14
MKSIHILNMIFLIVNFLFIVWGVKGAFEKKVDHNPNFQIIKITTIITMSTEILALAMVKEINYTSSTISIFLIILASAIFWSAVNINKNKKLSVVFSNDLPEHLMNIGIYKFIRHPFYVSYIISYIGGILASLNILLVIPVFTMIFIYYKAAKYEETKFLKSNLSNNYLEYKQKTGMFFPKSLWAIHL